jgi:signal transduction histidine kinase
MEKNTPRPAFWRGLSGKVLVLTVLFVLAGEVLIFLPSIANFRLTWLENRLAAAEVAVMAADAAPQGNVPPATLRALLVSTGAYAVTLTRDGLPKLDLHSASPPPHEAVFDLRHQGAFGTISDALWVMVSPPRIIAVGGNPPHMNGSYVEVVINETALKRDMLAYARNILILSLMLSVMVAGLVFVVLNRVFVRPVRHLTREMLRFAERPENPAAMIRQSGRSDEIGIAERELAAMQADLQNLLKQKSHLAALGLAVSKISHDLRNMLAAAQLISGRLGDVNDPTVQKLAPKLIASLDRAIDFCAATLRFGKASEASPRRAHFVLFPLVEDVLETARLEALPEVALVNGVEAGLMIDADREALFRILLNLARNALAVLAQPRGLQSPAPPPRLAITARAVPGGTMMEISDNGPGFSKRAREHLFEPFQGSGRAGGTGLGLVIARELVEAHGGVIELLSSGPEGTVFRLVIPDSALS